VILGKTAEWVQPILAAIQSRMLLLIICKTDVPVILCGHEILCLMSQEPMLRVCESMVVRRIFGVRGR